MSSSQPVFFSIVIPSYNRAAFLVEAINSVLQQVFENWELIVIDDGSTDHTAEVVKKIANTDARVFYHYVENGERSRARNLGIGLSVGKYICFLDSDDTFLPENLQEWFSFLKMNKFPICLSYGDFKLRQEGKTSILRTPLPKDNLITFLYRNPIVPPRVCISREILMIHQFEEDITVGEDMTLWLKIAMDYPVLYHPHLCFQYLAHDANTTNPNSNAPVLMLQGLKRFFSRYPLIKNAIPTTEYSNYQSEILINTSRYYFLNGKRTKAFAAIVKALILAPKHPQTRFRIRLLVLSLISNDQVIYE